MSITTVPVTIVAADQNGNPVSGARITATLDQTEVYNGFVVPEKVSAVANASGVCVLNLWPNALGANSSTYRITAVNPDTGRRFLEVSVAVPNSACNMHEILMQDPYPAVDASQQALAAAQGALALVTAQAGIATASAGDAADSEAAAASSAASALSSSQTATSERALAQQARTDASAAAATASNQAATSTTKAGEASASATASAADRVQTGLDRAQTTADRAQTGADRTAVALDRSQVALDRVATAADRTQTGADVLTAATHATTAANRASEALTSREAAAVSATAAAADRVQTGLDRVATGADRAQVAVDAAAANAKAIEAAASEDVATAKALEAATSAAGAAADRVQTGLDAATATAGAAVATTKLNEITASAATANAKAGEAAGSAAQALAIYGTAQAQQTAIATAAAQASLAAGYAASAASVAQQDLSGVTAAALHRSPNVVTAMTVYDTSKDSDGGAWTERCQGTSWYNEPINGKWLGAQASELEARNANAVLGPELVTTSPIVSAAIGGPTVTEYQTGASVLAGKTYEVTFTVSEYSGGGSIGMISGAAVAGNGTYRGIYSFVSQPIRMFTRSTNSATFSNISVREVISQTTQSGDYFQRTTDGKFYRLWKNQLSFSNQLDNAIYPSPQVTLTQGSTAFNGNATAWKMVETSANGGHAITRVIAVPANTAHTVSFYAKAAERSVISIYSDLVGAYTARINLNTGVVTGTTLVVVTPAGNDWYRISYSGVLPWATRADAVAIVDSSNNVSYTGDGVSGVLISDFQLEYGSEATAYEPKGPEGAISEVFRGNKRSFPKLAGIVAEAGSVTLYDLAEPGRPMWMRFAAAGNVGSWAYITISQFPSVNGLSSVNGLLSVSHAGNVGCLSLLSFAADTVRYFRNGNNYGNAPRAINIASRQATTAPNAVSETPPTLNNTVSNAVAMTVLPDAPVDPVTGLKLPTIAVATNGGVSVIKHNGTVVNSSSTVAYHGVILSKEWLFLATTSGSFVDYARNPGALGASFATTRINPNTAPDFARGISTKILQPSRGFFVRGGSNPLVTMLRNNEDAVAKGQSAVIANTHNTGHLIGDIRRAYLSDVDVGGVTGPELVTNGTFDTWADPTVPDGWFKAGTHNASNYVEPFPEGSLHLVSDGTYVSVTQAGFLTVGKFYKVEVTISTVADAAVAILIGSGTDYYIASTGTFSFVRQAAGTNLEIKRYAATGAVDVTIDNISVREVIPDRSYKAQGANIEGTLTRSQVAQAAQLVAYSGFSSENYLREPYSADLDFGLGEWNASAWVNVPAVLPVDSFPVVGPELVTNGDFSDGTTGWFANISNEAPLTSEYIVDGAIQFASSANPGQPMAFQVLSGNFYRFNFRAKRVGSTTVQAQIRVSGRYSANAVTVWNGGNIGTEWTNYSILFPASAARNFIWLREQAGNGGTIAFDNISVRELGPSSITDRAYSSGAAINIGVNATGNLTATANDGTTTRTVTTTAAYNTATWLKAEAEYTTDGTLSILVNGVEVAATRGAPLLSLNSRYNLLTKTEDFSDSAWSKVAVTVTTNATTAPDGATTADKIVATNTASATRGVYESISPVLGVQYVIGFSVKASEYSKLCVAEIGNGRFGATFDLTAETTTSLGGAGFVSSSITATGNGWYRCVIVATAGSSGWSVAAVGYPTGAVLSAAGCSYAGDGTSGVFIWGASIVPAALSALPYQWVNTATDFNFSAPLTIGNSYAGDAPFPGSIALLKLSATAPTAEQALWMYEQEKKMFREGAQVTLPDSGAIADLAYDDATDKWIAVSAANESEWSGLVRTSVTPTPAGSYSKVSAASGVQLLARTTTSPGVDITMPAQNLREELVKRAESAARLNAQLATFDYVGGFTATTTSGSTSITSAAGLTYPVSYVGARVTGSGIPADTFVAAVVGTTVYLTKAATASASAVQISFTDFILPVGYEAKVVLAGGANKVEGATKDFTRLFDGFKETIRFGTAPGHTAAIQIQATRSAA